MLKQAIDLSLKIKILQEVDRGIKTKKNIAAEFKIPKSTLSTILKNREKIFNAIALGSMKSKSKRMRTARHEDLEDKVLK